MINTLHNIDRVIHDHPVFGLITSGSFTILSTVDALTKFGQLIAVIVGIGVGFYTLLNQRRKYKNGGKNNDSK